MAYRFNLLLHIGEISTIRDIPWSSHDGVRAFEGNRDKESVRETSIYYLSSSIFPVVSVCLSTCKTKASSTSGSTFLSAYNFSTSFSHTDTCRSINFPDALTS